MKLGVGVNFLVYNIYKISFVVYTSASAVTLHAAARDTPFELRLHLWNTNFGFPFISNNKPCPASDTLDWIHDSSSLVSQLMNSW
jgi:hypothetical protein